MNDLSPFRVIAHLHSPLKSSFGAPRQAILSEYLRGIIVPTKEFSSHEFWEGLEGMSHLWVTSYAHRKKSESLSPKIRPPRLGGNKKVGVFSSRTLNRPNPIGLSLVEIDHLEFSPSSIKIYIKGHDLIDQTPILDIKPYLPEADSPRGEVKTGWIESEEHPRLNVHFTLDANDQLKQLLPKNEFKKTKKVIAELLSMNIRPRYLEGESSHTFRYDNLDIKFIQDLTTVIITQVINC